MLALKLAHDEVEARVAEELEKAYGTASAHRREMEEARAKIAELQKDLEKANTQKSYATDAFENSRKECSRLRAEKQANEQDIARLRRMVEELQADRTADVIGRRAVHSDLQALEVERDVLGRALGTATKQLFSKQQAAAEARESAAASPAAKVRPGSAAKKGKPPIGRAISSPAGHSTPRQTGGGGRRR